MKGELRFSLGWFRVTIGWQRAEAGAGVA
jgi:hypothetical protein